MTAPELKPCPYCGAVDGVEIYWYRALSPDVYAAVRCSNCGTRGPNQGTNVKAVGAWNDMARNYELDEMVMELGKRAKAMQRLARALRVKNRALALAQRECKHAQDRAAEAEKELDEWKQAAVLRWTTSVPNRAGWYWNRVAGKEALPMRLYYDSNGEYCYQVAGLPDECWLVSELADEVGCEWAGPIDEPKEKKQ